MLRVRGGRHQTYYLFTHTHTLSLSLSLPLSLQMKRQGTPMLRVGGGRHQTDPVRVRAAERIRPMLQRMSIAPAHLCLVRSCYLEP